jgi:AmmeMemoRadiSam system protein A
VASTDLSHYLPYADAAAKDKETIRSILDLEYEKLLKEPNAACGKIPVSIILSMARSYGWQPVLLHYSNSGDTAGTRDRVVGYAAIAFFGELDMKKTKKASGGLTEQQGLSLVNLARQTITERLGQKTTKSDAAAVSRLQEDEALRARRGTFVTLSVDGQLRGCIGTLTPTESIYAGVKRNAINAAFYDPRFQPLSAEELKHVDIEISILTDPQPLDYNDGNDLTAKLRPKVDGVILRKGSARATFLPQVWDQLARPDDFLTHLCLKAGLPGDTWQTDKLEVLTYQVQYFEEE